MVAENNVDNVVSVNNHQAPGPEKIQIVQASKPLQTLPEEGKQLPPAEQLSPADADVLPVEDLGSVIQSLNDSVQSVQRELHFSVDDDSGRVVIKVFDLQSEELIRQIPIEEALKFARLLKEGEKLELFSAIT